MGGIELFIFADDLIKFILICLILIYSKENMYIIYKYIFEVALKYLLMEILDKIHLATSHFKYVQLKS